MANNDITVKFNNRLFSFSRQSLSKKIAVAAKNAPPTDASTLMHRITVPGLKAPVSVQWFANYILETPPVGLSKNGNPKGAYSPQQVLSVASALAPLGVKVESVSPSAKYAKWSKAGAEALQKQIDDIRRALGQSPTTRKAVARKVTSKRTRKETAEAVTEADTEAAE